MQAGYLVRAHRQRQGITPTAMVKRCGVALVDLRRIEQGKQAPSRQALVRMAVGLRLSEDETATVLIAGGYIPPGYTAVQVPAAPVVGAGREEGERG